MMSFARVKGEADRIGLKAKVRQGAGQRMLGGRPLGRGHIYRLLSNPLYVGRIAHRGESYEGQHAAIIDPETWDAVQKLLGAQAPSRGSRAGSARPSPLRGKLFDESGVVLTPSHAVKSGRRYRYYLSRSSHSNSTTSNPEHGRSPRWRLPAQEIERLIGDVVAALIANRAELARVA